MSVVTYLAAFVRNIDLEHLPLYITHITCVAWLAFLTVSRIPEAELGVLPEAASALMVMLAVNPLLPGVKAAVGEWRGAA